MNALILMATYNGARFLEPQLESIQRQTASNWSLLVSDDGSSDSSAEILHGFCGRESRATLLPRRDGPRGACANFEYLLTQSTVHAGAADAVFLCDQDDLWRPEKLQRQFALLADTSGCHGDAQLIDADGHALPGTFAESIRAREVTAIADLLAQNSVLGCSLAVRAEVLELALPFPAGLINHDWWLALCCLALDGLVRSNAALLDYRQHGGNVVGGYRPAQQWRRLPQLLRRQRAVLRSQGVAAAALEQRLAVRGLPVPDALPAYCAMLGATPAARSRAMLRGRFAAAHRPLRGLRAAAALTLGISPRLTP